MEEINHLLIDIPESGLDFSDDSWKEIVKRDFQEIRNALEKNPNNGSPAYYTWFLFFLKYGRAICSDECKKYLKEHNISVFNMVRDAVGLKMTSGGAYTVGYKFYDECIKNSKAIDAAGIFIHIKKNAKHNVLSIQEPRYNVFLRAMRTKPFLLLAGISGTGKSRIVKQMAFDSCPSEGDLAIDPTSPGNYCLVEVKPNWHDSSELLGYRSNIGGAHYVLTPLVRFLAKAMLHPEAPFFVCLDEMNLAPVEQYFAEFLSVLESRTKVNDKIVSEPLIKGEVFSALTSASDLFNMDQVAEIYKDRRDEMPTEYKNAFSVYEGLKTDGLRIPENVIIIGTVNMDETTHQFSRKVIDRAMTIEMNLPEGNPFMDFFANSSQLTYREAPLSRDLYLASEVRAADVIQILAEIDAEKTEILKKETATFLTNLNNALDNTPFKVAYRVQNELILYFYQSWIEDKPVERWSEIFNLSCDQILMMKVLPRIEGDDELLEEPLKSLSAFCSNYPNAHKKVEEMKARLEKARFTSFWP